jgi:hypothetical protein
MDDLAVVGGRHVRIFREGEAHLYVLALVLVLELPSGQPGFHGWDPLSLWTVLEFAYHARIWAI